MVYEQLKGLFESKDKKLIREVLEMNPDVKDFMDNHPGYSVKRDKYVQPSVEDCKLTALEELWTSMLGSEPPKWKNYEHPENLALFEINGAPKLIGSKPGVWIYNYRTTYKQDTLKVCVDRVKGDVLETMRASHTYEENENVLPAKS